ncbi:multiple epidermal growth factor-like domains protein 10 [Saccostrea echinata]|uniref:multiple epidermal growth factor-like domains protein 10 n=1 Tax=Saccostrea echinata TaxID=191078 RepID=UPI002A8018B7|nr:multiple epidermal growth factor-like domains protein 10 [Saccostrea echinata]
MTFTGVTIAVLVFTNDFVFCYENLSLNKPTYQSHPYFTPVFSSDTFDSSNAVDGLKNNLSAFGGQCATSADGYKTATWWVNLTYIHSIHDIRMYYRTDNAHWGASNGYTSRFLGFYVYISNTTHIKDGHLCFHDTNYTRSTIPAVVNIRCQAHGQYVIYFNERPQTSSNADQFSIYAHNELCEVEVFGCNDTGFYGPTCSLPCPGDNCRSCEIDAGVCTRCKPGYMGHQCELPCSYSFYGNLCSLKCGNCSSGATCHHVNGSCTNGCDVGVYGDKCNTPCSDGWHGRNCSTICDKCDSCDRFTGECTSACKTGWKGPFCTEECGNGTYGDTCIERCGTCIGLKQCHHINGSCPDGCEAGYQGELCQNGCSSGKFGINCDEDCNENCAEPYKCNGTTGECEGGCQPGWEGLQCKDVCRENMYGKYCTILCGFCRYSTCHHVNGSCFGGCAKGFHGALCNKACKAGFYGEDCIEECSPFCRTPRDCNHMTGHCNKGCIGGWQGVKCLEEKSVNLQCSSRFYGVLAALCVSITIIIVLLVFTYINRRRAKEIYKKQNVTNDIEVMTGKLDLQMISGTTVEDESSKYQELGELSLSSDYDHLR